jgi:hypothetical protein
MYLIIKLWLLDRINAPSGTQKLNPENGYIGQIEDCLVSIEGRIIQ